MPYMVVTCNCNLRLSRAQLTKTKTKTASKTRENGHRKRTVNSPIAARTMRATIWMQRHLTICWKNSDVRHCLQHNQHALAESSVGKKACTTVHIHTGGACRRKIKGSPNGHGPFWPSVTSACHPGQEGLHKNSSVCH